MSHWPVPLRGVTESVVTTRGPNDRYNAAPLGLYAPEDPTADPRARTWGRTRTWRNFTERGEGWVQFLRDPVLFTEAALGIHEVDDPVLDGADAWVQVAVEQLDTGQDGGTGWVDWRLSPVDHAVRRRMVPTFNRGYAAVVEATVAASRLDVEAYDTDRLRERIDYFEDVARRAGGPAEQAAFERLHELVEGSG